MTRHPPARLAALLAALVDLVLPTRCGGCGAVEGPICASCAPALAEPARRRDPTPAPPGLPAVFAVAGYAGPVRAMLLAHKEQARFALTRPLGTAVAAAVWTALAGEPRGTPVAVVPVPSRGRARRSRGHDPPARLAQAAATLLRRRGADVAVVSALRHTRTVADQAGLGASERRANLHGALAVRPRAAPRLAGRAVVVVDDVVTTGATAAEAARAVRAAGGRVVGVAAVAATARSATAAGIARRSRGDPNRPIGGSSGESLASMPEGR